MDKLTLSHVNMNYHTIQSETEALKDISFSVKSGEFISIVGPSGCGKSTILNLISGLLFPSKGNILIDNKKITGPSSKIGYMFQKDQLFGWLTVWNNVLLGLKILHKVNDSNIENVKKLLSNYNLLDFKDFYPDQLSGGMRQRVALIRTLALNPEILLLDEPFSALDYQSRLKASDEIYTIIKQENKTAIMVTHDIAEAISMSNRIIILSKRPAIIKNILESDLCRKYNSPLKAREAPEFRLYFNTIWEELDIDD